MRIVVTGGAGFIGFHTCKELLKRGHEVVVLDDLSTGKQQNLDDLGGIEFIKGDIRDDSIVDALDGANAVIHLAAKVSVRESIESPSFTSLTNVYGFINVVDKARLLGIKRIVYASSAAVYGDGTQATLAFDNHEDEGLTPISPYGLDKLTNERYAKLFQNLYGVQMIGLRYFNVYGPRQDPSSQYAGVIGKFIKMALEGKPLTIFGDGEQVRNFVYVGDIAKVNASAILGNGGFQDYSGPVNVGKPEGVVSLNMLVRKLNKLLKRPISLDYQAPVPGDIKRSIPDLGKFTQIYKDHPEMVDIDEGLGELITYMTS